MHSCNNCDQYKAPSGWMTHSFTMKSHLQMSCWKWKKSTCCINYNLSVACKQKSLGLTITSFIVWFLFKFYSTESETTRWVTPNWITAPVTSAKSDGDSQQLFGFSQTYTLLFPPATRNQPDEINTLVQINFYYTTMSSMRKYSTVSMVTNPWMVLDYF